MYWGGILGSISVLVYAVFIWQFPWYIYAAGTTYLQGAAVQVFKPVDAPDIRVGAVHRRIAEPHSLVAKDQLLFSVQADKIPNMQALQDFYTRNQDILFNALLTDTEPVFLTAQNAYEQRVIEYYRVAYQQDRTHIENVYPSYMDRVNINAYVAYLKAQAPAVQQQVFDHIITPPITETVFVASPVNGFIEYVQTYTDIHMPVAVIYPIDAPLAVKIYVPADTFTSLTENKQVTVYYGQTLRISGSISAMVPDDTDADGHMAVVVRVSDTYIYENSTRIAPKTPVQVAIPQGKGSVYAYVRDFLTVTF